MPAKNSGSDDLAPHFSASALLVIDMQNDFALPDAPARINGTMEVLPRVVELVNAYRQAHLPVVHVVRLYHRDGSNAELCRRSLIRAGKSIVAPETHGAEVLDALRAPAMWRLDSGLLLQGRVQPVGDREVVMYKPRWGAFFETPLDSCLQEWGVNTVVFCGCNFPNCPRASIYGASERDYRIVLATDAVSRITPQGIAELENIGVNVLGTGAIVRSLKGLGVTP